MSEARHYSKAPITEAVIDLRVHLRKGVPLTAFSEIQTQIKADYPKRRTHARFEGELKMGAEVGATASQKNIGYVFVSADEKQIIQATSEGFAFSRLAPYDCWDTFCAEARRMWTVYAAQVRPEAVTRIAVRYINRLDLPLPITDFKHYLRTVPEVAPELPQGLSGYFMQLQIPHADIAATVVLNQALLPSASPSLVSILLDIDLFRGTDIPIDESSLWGKFAELHQKKNEIFEACITEKTRELIN